MLIESLFLGGLGVLSLLALTPSLLGPTVGALGDKVTDSITFTIKLMDVGPEVTVVGYSAPSELEVGKVPTVTVTVKHNRKRYEWIFARIRDVDTTATVCPMKKQYVEAKKEFTFTFTGLGPSGDWGAVMPNRDWNLQLEVGLWWV